MLAEIHNKISQTGSNLSNRLEDKLTGDFFGALRYLPYEFGLRHIFSTTEFSNQNSQKKWIDFIDSQKEFEITFWPRHEEGEIDLIITINKVLIGIEVKYLSGISSEDQDVENLIEDRESINQLARYSRMMEKISDNEDIYLLFLAPYEMMNTVMKNMQSRSIISPSVQLGFLCWQDIFESLKLQVTSLLEKEQQLILEDLQALLMKKGFTRFRGFSGEIINQPLTESTYIFRTDNIGTKDNWVWPTDSIKENDYYVFNNTK